MNHTLATRESIWGRVSSRAEDRNRALLLHAWRRPPSVARLVAEIEARRLIARLSFRPYDPAAIRAELLSGATIDTYDFGPFARHARSIVQSLRRADHNIAALGHGTGRFQLLPAGAERPPRSRLRSSTRERLLAGQTVTIDDPAYRWPIINAVSDLRRAGHAVVCLGGAYAVVPSPPSCRGTERWT